MCVLSKTSRGITSGNNRCLKDTVKLWLFVKPVMLKFMFVKMRKTNGEPYTGRLVRTVRGQALGNLPSQDDKAPSAEPTIYHYLGCSKPFSRLWISSLTDKAIRQGMENLKDGREYDNLYRSAKARSEADWLVGINASQALCLSAGRGVFSLGRVQTPTLMMICNRYMENKNFTPQKYWQLRVQSGKADITFSALSNFFSHFLG